MQTITTKLIKFLILLFALLIYLQNANCVNNPNIFVDEQHKLRLESLFNIDLEANDTNLSNIYYALIGLNILYNSNLNTVIQTHKKNGLCRQLQSFINHSQKRNLDNLYYASSSLKILNCQFDKNQLFTLAEPSITPKANISTLFKAIGCVENAGKQLKSARIAKLLNDALDKDSSLLSAGLALQLSAKLNRSDQSPFVSRIPKLIARADEIDARYLQFQGGLGVTASIVKGILDLSTAANRTKTGLTDLQVIKLLNYFLKRLTVKSSKNAANLISILKQLTNNKYHLPVVVSLYGSNVFNEQNSNIILKITNALGEPLDCEFKVIAKLTSTNGKNLSEELKFSPVEEDSTMYTTDLTKQIIEKLSAGQYNLKLRVAPKKVNKILIINKEPSEFNVIIQSSQIKLESIEIGTAEKDAMTVRHKIVEYPNSLKKKIKCESNQKISIRFCVRDLIRSEDLTVQQSLIYFMNNRTGKEIIFIVDQDRRSKVYNKQINLSTRGRDFNYESGDYSIRLVVGDSRIVKSIDWVLAKVNIQFYNQDPIEESSWMDIYRTKHEIDHKFREPEIRPSLTVSHTFTLLALSPILILLVGWPAIGVNFSKFKFSPSTILFHSSLLAVFILYTLFFVQFNMLATLKYLSILLIVVFISGHFCLRSLAAGP